MATYSVCDAIEEIGDGGVNLNPRNMYVDVVMPHLLDTAEAGVRYM